MCRLSLLFILLFTTSTHAQNLVRFGLEIEIESSNEYSKVTSVLPGSSAQKADIQVGDKIVSIDKKDVKGKMGFELYPLLNGAENTTVAIQLKRGQEMLLKKVVRKFIVDQFGTTCLSGDCKNGKGTLKYKDGSTYTGQFREGLKYGEGVYSKGKMKIKSYEWDEDKSTPIAGTIIYEDGRKYVGHFLQQSLLPEGFGVMSKNTNTPYNQSDSKLYKNGQVVALKKTKNTNPTNASAEDMKKARAQWDKALGVVKSGTTSGDFDFKEFQRKSIRIATQFKELEEVYFIGIRKQNKCLENHWSGKFTYRHLLHCQKQFLKDIARLNTYFWKFSEMYKEVRTELKKAGCNIENIHSKFERYDNNMSLIDQGFKKIYDNTYVFISRVEATKKDETARTLFKDHISSIKNIHQNIRKHLDDYAVFYDKWSKQIKSGCK